LNAAKEFVLIYRPHPVVKGRQKVNKAHIIFVWTDPEKVGIGTEVAQFLFLGIHKFDFRYSVVKGGQSQHGLSYLSPFSGTESTE
jgi:hypothetical protein